MIESGSRRRIVDDLINFYYNPKLMKCFSFYMKRDYFWGDRSFSGVLAVPNQEVANILDLHIKLGIFRIFRNFPSTNER